MDWPWLWEVLRGSLDSVLNLVVVAIPLMIGIELIKHYKLVEKIAPYVAKPIHSLNLPDEGILPVVSGIFFGITMGAGVIIQASQEKILNRQQMTAVALSLCICHSVVEDHVLFWRVGLSTTIPMIFARLLLAFFITLAYVKLASLRKKKDSDAVPEQKIV